jgi:hypothetical protein
MDWLDQYLDGMGNYKTTVSPADTHTWGVKPAPNAQQKRMIFDAAAQSETELRQLVAEARREEERQGMGPSYGIGADPGSYVTTSQPIPEAICTDEVASVIMNLVTGPSGILHHNGEWNGKPSYTGAGNVVQHSGDLWYYSIANGGGELATANLGNENYPWLATWSVGVSAAKQCPACTDVDALVWIDGSNDVWPVELGSRTLARVADRHYVYIGGDEVIKHDGTAWEYYYVQSSVKTVIESVVSNQPWPWLVPWEDFTARKVCYLAYNGGAVYSVGSKVSHGGYDWECVSYAGAGYGPFGGFLDGSANGTIYWIPA